MYVVFTVLQHFYISTNALLSFRRLLPVWKCTWTPLYIQCSVYSCSICKCRYMRHIGNIIQSSILLYIIPYSTYASRVQWCTCFEGLLALTNISFAHVGISLQLRRVRYEMSCLSPIKSSWKVIKSMLLKVNNVCFILRTVTLYNA